ncbi:MBL fold metallo-hydrolase [Nitrospirillum sp. BR 11164]|uniref:MBL fold metallo-hydrolase n=1 Tax=Nitrospirillum sp. BR 11164 TaxID=3104324 RepID=UPI002AFF33DE|nr:MBL fold metallo-hydrolase [Nitrospirillum sp. BR 11164]MEA1652917.1 MBL fold metallo-hydrolase [Nitrospirillum sp. BR 11164]
MASLSGRLKAVAKMRAIKAAMWVLAGLGTATLVAVAGLALTFIPAKLDLPAVDVGDLPPASPPAGMSISALPTGTYGSPAALTYRGGSWSDVRHLAATAILVRHPKGDLLIDTGFGRNIDDHMRLIPPMQRTPQIKGLPAIDQLAAGGVHPGDIAAIIPTHSHWDHISGVDDFHGVPVMETAAGRHWINSKPKGSEVINSFRDINYKSYEFDGGPYLGFPRSHDLFGDGSVVIVPASAHTPDSVIVFVSLPSGDRYALVGDLVFQMEGIEIPAEKPWLLRWLIGENAIEMHRDIALVRAIREKFPQVHLVPAHDSLSFGTIPVFPASAP